MWGRETIALAVALGVLLAGGTVAALSSSRAVAGPAPLRAAPGVPDAGVGSSEVLLSADARSHPAAQAVQAQLQRYFDAINAKDYATWAGTVVDARSAGQPEPEWRDAYASTRDGTIRIDRIDDLDGGRVLLRVRFVSSQDLADAPAAVQAERICWRSSLPMSGEPPLIELTGAGSSRAEAC